MSKNYTIVRKRRSFLIAVAVLASVMTVILPSSQSLAIGNQAIINGTNAERRANGLTSLAWNSALTKSAELKAQDMCAVGYWAHTAPSGATGWTFMTQAGYRYRTAGENLAKDFTSDAGVVSGWMASPGHRANILNGEYADIGVAAVTCAFQGAETTIVVAHYGATNAAPKPVATVAPQPVASTQPQPFADQPKAQVAAAKLVASPQPESLALPVEEPPQTAKLATGFGQKLWNLISKSQVTKLFILSARFV